MQDEELLRYSRQILLPDVDVEGQEKLLNAKVLIVGLGGLGSPVAMYLAAAGVGELYLADFDEVDVSNLQRQIVHASSRIGVNKAQSARQHLLDINPHCRVRCYESRLTDAECETVFNEVDAVVDCTDNFSTRFMLNQLSVKTKTPLVSGAAIRLEGQVTVYDPRSDESPCYRCLYEYIDDSQLSCSQNGVLAPLVGIIGSVQATETIKLIAEFGQPLVGRLLLLDAKSMQWRELLLKRDPKCPVCGEH
ncbi:molybdopterin-synthase adenylyltransferase MoeB [Aurantivibrio plasticivorans]